MPRAERELRDLEFDEDRRDLVKLKKVRKCLGLLQMDPRHPGLNSHVYESLAGVSGVKVWESYVENNVSTAWRVFWHYGPSDRVITIITITPHP